ncbi:MAG: metal ABC transporter substrate-binding protein, partial [Gemmatimonadota bacterium]
MRRTAAFALLLLTALSLGACGCEAPADRGSPGGQSSSGAQAAKGLADTAAVGPDAAPADSP